MVVRISPTAPMTIMTIMTMPFDFHQHMHGLIFDVRNQCELTAGLSNDFDANGYGASSGREREREEGKKRVGRRIRQDNETLGL